MNLLHNGVMVLGVPSNPPHCNDLGALCPFKCDNEFQLTLSEDYRCEYLREIKDPNQRHGKHGTRDEKRFYDKVGSYSKCKMTRKELLKKALKDINVRSMWGKIDKEEVVRHIKQLIEEEV